MIFTETNSSQSILYAGSIWYLYGKDKAKLAQHRKQVKTASQPRPEKKTQETFTSLKVQDFSCPV